MKKSYYILFLAMLMAAAFLTLGNSLEAAEKVLTIAVDEEIEGTDTHQIYWYSPAHEIISEPLIRLDLATKNVVPALASKFEISNDGKDLIFTIPQGLTFTNGDPLSVEDVKASIERYKEVSPYASDYAAIEDVVIRDGNKLVLKASKPPAYIWPALCSVASGVMNPRVIKSMDKAAFNRKAVTFGPAAVDKWVQGSHIMLVKNPNYRTHATYFDNKGPIYFDKIKVRFIPDAFTRVSEFLAGNIDIIWSIPKENVDEFIGNDKFGIFEGLSDGVNWIMVNHRNAPLDDYNVRRAIALAVDREQLRTVLADRVMVTYGMLSPSQICYSAEGDAEFKKENAMNIEAAKGLLAEAGWQDKNGDGILEKGGKSLEIGMAVPLDRAPLKRSAPVIQAQLKNVGIKLNLREYETSYVKQAVRDHKYDLALRAYSWLDPSDLSYKFHTESGIYSDPALDKLLDEGLYIMDNQKRAQKYTAAQKQIFAKAVAIPLFVEKNYHGWQKNIKGLKFETTGGNMFINDAYRE